MDWISGQFEVRTCNRLLLTLPQQLHWGLWLLLDLWHTTTQSTTSLQHGGSKGILIFTVSSQGINPSFLWLCSFALDQAPQVLWNRAWPQVLPEHRAPSIALGKACFPGKSQKFLTNVQVLGSLPSQASVGSREAEGAVHSLWWAQAEHGGPPWGPHIQGTATQYLVTEYRLHLYHCKGHHGKS